MATEAKAGGGDFTAGLGRIYGIYTGGFFAFIILVAILERAGVPNKILGYMFMGFTILVYAFIGVVSRTAEVGEYYVAGRKVPAFYNGMATGADWMSAASFIGMAGTLFLLGYDGLAFVLGWTGGYVLVAVLIAPFLRKFGAYTVPDFLSARFGGNTRAPVRRDGADGLLLHLRGGADLRYGPDRPALPGHELRTRLLRRPRRHSGVLDARRHEGRDLDAGGAVHRADRRLPDPRHLDVGQQVRPAHPAAHLRQALEQISELEQSFIKNGLAPATMKIHASPSPAIRPPTTSG